MNRHLLSAGFLLLTSAFAAATPVVSGVSGTVGDDQTVVISGSGFGSNSLKQTWWGGASGVVDSLTNGTRIDSLNLSGLTLLQPSTSTYPHVSTERSWSHGKSVAFDVRNTTEYKQTLFFDIGSAGYSSLYTNAIIYLQHDDLISGTLLQWKMMRWTRTQTVVDGDGAYMSNRIGSSSFFSNFNSAGQTVFWFGESGLPGRGAWYRYETWMKLNSAPGVADGVFHVKVTDVATGSIAKEYSYSNVVYNGSGNSGNFRYVTLQNYFGNANDSGSNKQPDNGNAVAWWDDIYISQSQARVEVCNASTWSKCTTREIQPASTWSDGSVTVKLNKGSGLDLSNAYVYVVDANGAVNSTGYKLSGGSTTVDVAPAPPSNLTATPQ